MGLLSVIGCWKIRDDKKQKIKREVDPTKRKGNDTRELLAIVKSKRWETECILCAKLYPFH
jgi:hypothetical protein